MQAEVEQAKWNAWAHPGLLHRTEAPSLEHSLHFVDRASCRAPPAAIAWVPAAEDGWNICLLGERNDQHSSLS